MLITQDKNLALDIIAISKGKAVETKNRILAERINPNGFLSVFNAPSPNPVPRPAPRQPRTVSNDVPDEERFAFATTLTRLSGNLSVSYIPKESDEVIVKTRNGQSGRIQLVKQGASGGEGTIYETSLPGYVAKIYRREKIDLARHEKLKLMLTRPIDCEGVCFPLATIYNTQNEFVGYLMKKASGKELQKCVFIPQLLKTLHPDWKKTDTVQLCITILKKLKYLHERNVILGDINPNNILVESPTEVYFVDTDSYQIEGFPCPVGTINFTAPEIQRKKFDTFLRTLGNERFAVATLLFMIMLPGKPPYSLQGGENQIDNILNGDFAYASGSKSNGKAPEGMWRYCWSHLPRYLKDDFYETFRKGEPHSTEKTRYSTGDWLEKFEHYLDLLKSGKLVKQDEMSMDLFPTRLKKNKNATYIKCRLCGTEVEEDQTEEGICRNCLKQGEIYRCAKCGCEMVYTNRQKYVRHLKRYEICKNCFDKQNMVYKYITCIDCGSVFEFTYRDKEFYESKGYDLPKKCKNCRSGGSSHSYVPPAHPYVSPGGSQPQPTPTPHKRGLCFITTAVCKYFAKPDDCYELTTLRNFRDNWLAATRSGKALIKEYYEVAPKIVEKINALDNQEEVYRGLWDNYISPCIQLIELGMYEDCRELYIKMVTELKNVYCVEK